MIEASSLVLPSKLSSGLSRNLVNVYKEMRVTIQFDRFAAKFAFWFARLHKNRGITIIFVLASGRPLRVRKTTWFMFRAMLPLVMAGRGDADERERSSRILNWAS